MCAYSQLKYKEQDELIDHHGTLPPITLYLSLTLRLITPLGHLLVRDIRTHEVQLQQNQPPIHRHWYPLGPGWIPILAAFTASES